jgi:hypothetical protein
VDLNRACLSRGLGRHLEGRADLNLKTRSSVECHHKEGAPINDTTKMIYDKENSVILSRQKGAVELRGVARRGSASLEFRVSTEYGGFCQSPKQIWQLVIE